MPHSVENLLSLDILQEKLCDLYQYLHCMGISGCVRIFIEDLQVFWQFSMHNKAIILKIALKYLVYSKHPFQKPMES